MAFDSDVALLGTGVAPLIAAHRLLEEGKTVLLLNPEHDFFSEDSELSIDPLLPLGAPLDPPRLARSQLETALAELGPPFPGAIETWPAPAAPASGAGRYRDPFAPYVRARNRLWAHLPSPVVARRWEELEDRYVESSDAGFHPQLLEGYLAARRFPGFSSRVAESAEWVQEVRALMVPRLCDVDVRRYRNGLLEFVRERVSAERIVCPATQVDVIAEGVRFHAGGSPRTARLRDGLLVFWTPRLTQWVLAQAKRSESRPPRPRGVRLWEEWTLVSRDPLDPATVGAFEDMVVWPDVEGSPEGQGPLQRLTVLRAGGLLAADAPLAAAPATSWASSDSFRQLTRLCREFLKWDRYTVRSMRPRATMEWDASAPPAWPIGDRARVVRGADGWIVDVVKAARAAAGAES